jgi:hypothetical protein
MRLERGVQATGVAPHSSTLQFRSLDVKATSVKTLGFANRSLRLWSIRKHFRGSLERGILSNTLSLP